MMKNIINKNTIFGFMTGLMVMGGINVLAINYLYKSEDVSYKKSNDIEINVKSAIDDLYSLSSIGNATAEDISEGKIALVQGKLVTGTLKNNSFTKYTKTATKYGYQDCRINLSDIENYHDLTLNDIIVSIKSLGVDASSMQGWTTIGGDIYAGNYNADTGILTITSSYYYSFQAVWPLTVDVYIIK